MPGGVELGSSPTANRSGCRLAEQHELAARHFDLADLEPLQLDDHVVDREAVVGVGPDAEIQLRRPRGSAAARCRPRQRCRVNDRRVIMRVILRQRPRRHVGIHQPQGPLDRLDDTSSASPACPNWLPRGPAWSRRRGPCRTSWPRSPRSRCPCDGRSDSSRSSLPGSSRISTRVFSREKFFIW